MENLQYPIGKFQHDDAVTAEKRELWIRNVAGLPKRLEQAVAGLFGEGEGQPQPDQPTTPGEPTQPTQPDAPLETQLAAAVADIQRAYDAGEEALKNGDFTAYGQAQDDLSAAIDRANAIIAQLGTSVASPSATASPSPSPTSSG